MCVCVCVCPPADSPAVIAAPSMWTRPQIKDFKEKIRQDVDSVITVGRGEVVTVRVPTHEEGSYLFWEFATDHYDIGFGLFFEWSDASNASVSVHVSESSDEDDDEDGESPRTRQRSSGLMGKQSLSWNILETLKSFQIRDGVLDSAIANF